MGKNDIPPSKVKEAERNFDDGVSLFRRRPGLAALLIVSVLVLGGLWIWDKKSTRDEIKGLRGDIAPFTEMAKRAFPDVSEKEARELLAKRITKMEQEMTKMQVRVISPSTIAKAKLILQQIDKPEKVYIIPLAGTEEVENLCRQLKDLFFLSGCNINMYPLSSNPLEDNDGIRVEQKLPMAGSLHNVLHEMAEETSRNFRELIVTNTDPGALVIYVGWKRKRSQKFLAVIMYGITPSRERMVATI